MPMRPCDERRPGPGRHAWVYRMELIGTEYGPIVVTAADGDQGPVIRCPACWQEHTLQTCQLGSDIACPIPDCGFSLRVNPFVLSHARRNTGWLSRPRRRSR